MDNSDSIAIAVLKVKRQQHEDAIRAIDSVLKEFSSSNSSQLNIPGTSLNETMPDVPQGVSKGSARAVFQVYSNNKGKKMTAGEIFEQFSQLKKHVKKNSFYTVLSIISRNDAWKTFIERTDEGYLFKSN